MRPLPPPGRGAYAAVALLAPLASLVAVLALPLLAQEGPPRPRPVVPAEVVPGAPLEPPSTGGIPAVDRALARLSTHRRVLVVAAHPDDEDTRLLALVSRGMGGEAAYLSLTRGDGGQNLVGTELGVGLGLLRSRELQAARQVDGARQFFTRAYDFGYTRSLAETLERWPREVLLRDAARVVREFKPQVISAVFPADERGGHGQHQASGVIAREVFDLAGRDGAFPELRRQGLPPWKPLALYRSAWWDPEAATLRLPLGTLGPWTGRSLLQLAMAARSLHRSQDMGRLQPPGDSDLELAWEAGGSGAAARSLFAGIDTRLRAMAAPLPPGGKRSRIEERLDRVEEIARGARAHLGVDAPGTVDDLAQILRLLRAVRQDLQPPGSDAARQVTDLVDEKIVIASEALLAAAQVVLDAYAERETVVAGETLVTRAVFWNAGPRNVKVGAVRVDCAVGCETVSAKAATPDDDWFATSLDLDREIVVRVAADAAPTLPYFLRGPLQGDLYDWTGVADELKTRPFGPPVLRTVFELEIDGVPVVAEREVVFRRQDQALGEVRRPLRVVPLLEVTMEPELVVWPTGAKTTQRLRVAVRSHGDRPTAARLEVTPPRGWPVPPPRQIEITDPRGRVVHDFELRAPATVARGRHTVRAAAIAAGGKRYERSIALVDYPHIRPVTMPVPAVTTVAAGPIALPPVGRVGWIRGASDTLPELVRAVGVAVDVLDPAALDDATLRRYDAVVVGSRAYEVEPALARVNPRLLAYARGGGTLVVLYQQYPFVEGRYAPFALDIARPHGRVTDETAEVRVLDPAHPLFHAPNELVASDWEGWVQERGLYFAGTWDAAYQPLLMLADPDREPELGSLLVAPLGDGVYVYTGLSFFRQLPAGVVGAYRLFMNLLALDGEALAGPAAAVRRQGPAR